MHVVVHCAYKITNAHVADTLNVQKRAAGVKTKRGRFDPGNRTLSTMQPLSHYHANHTHRDEKFRE